MRIETKYNVKDKVWVVVEKWVNDGTLCKECGRIKNARVTAEVKLARVDSVHAHEIVNHNEIEVYYVVTVKGEHNLDDEQMPVQRSFIERNVFASEEDATASLSKYLEGEGNT